MGKFIEIFRDEKRISQIRLNIPNLSNNIRNLKLIFSQRHFKKPVMFFYEFHKIKAKNKVVEYYSNFHLDSYSEIEFKNNKRITKSFSPNGIDFAKETIIFDKNNKAVSIINRVRNMNGTITKSNNLIRKSE